MPQGVAKVLVVLMALAAAGGAAAQSSSRSAERDLAFAEALLAETSTDELAERLDLSDAQTEKIAPNLLDLTVLYYESNEKWLEWDREVMRLDTEMRALQNSDPPDHRAMLRLSREINRAREEMREDRKASRQALRAAHGAAVAVVEGALNDPQREQFRALLRDRRRQRTLAAEAHYAAERVDLVNLFLERELLSATEMGAVRPALERYAEDLDALLRDRNELIWREEDLKYEPPEPGISDRHPDGRPMSIEEFTEAYTARIRRQREEQIERLRPLMTRHAQIRDFTLAYYQQCLGLIETESIGAVQTAFLQTAYHMEGIAWPRSPDRLIDEVLALESLSLGQRERIDGIRYVVWEPLRAEVEGLMMQVVDRQQQQWEGRIRVEDEAWRGLQRQFRAAADRRRAIERDVVRRVVEVLTDEQRAAVKIPVYE